jgi:tRNA nucleotidyltransferase (CCA-adding enzyme)
VVKFGGFREVLQAAKGWKKGEAIALEDSTGTKLDSPLTFIDPVDPNRNVASAVSLESLSLFIVASGAYLVHPKMEFFFPNDILSLDLADIKNKLGRRGQVLALTLPKPDIIDDILYPQIRKFKRNLEQLFERKDFNVIRSWSGVIDEEIILLFKLRHFSLPHSALHKGPPVWVTENSDDFLSKWQGNPDAHSVPFIKDGHWHLFIRRKYLTAEEETSANLTTLDIGKDLSKFKQKIKLYGPEISSEPVMIKALSIFLDKRMPWER